MGQFLLVDSRKLDGFEGLHQAVHGSHVDVMQLGRGRLRGTLSHVGIGDFSLSIGAFNVGMRTQRVSSDDKLIIGMLLAAEERVAHWSFDMQLNDVLVIPPLLEHDGVFHGALRLRRHALRPQRGRDAVRRRSAAERSRHLAQPRSFPRGTPIPARSPRAAWSGSCRTCATTNMGLTPSTADFWKRSIAECMAANVVSSLPPDGNGWLPSARRLIRRVEEYLDDAGTRPVHVSEICAALGRIAAHPPPRLSGGVRPRPGQLPQAQASLRGSFHPAPERTRLDHRDGRRHAAGLLRARPVFAILPCNVRGASVANARNSDAAAGRRRYRQSLAL